MTRFALVAVFVCSLVTGCRCDGDGPPPPERQERPSIELSDGGLAVPSAAPSSSAAEAFVDKLRSQKLDIVARRVPLQRIAFGKGRLAQLTDSALVIRDTKAFDEITRVPVAGPRRLATLADGSSIVAAESNVLRVPKDPKKIETFGRIPLFVESVIFPDRRKDDQVWVAHGIDTTLYPYAFGEAGHLDTLDFIELPDFDQKGIALLKDGSFVYTAKQKLKRFFPKGKSWTLELPSGAEVWRILTTRRIDEVWIARSDGRLDLAQIAQGALTVVRSLEVPGAFDIASNDSELAILRLENATGGRVWRLSVLDGGGKQQLSVTLPFSLAPGAGESWVREVTKNRSLVLSSYGPFVGVGGAEEVTVYNYRTGLKAFAQSPNAK